MRPSDPHDACHRLLSAGQHRALLDIPRRIRATSSPQAFLQDLVTLVGSIVQAKVGVAGKPHGTWVLAAESSSAPPIPLTAKDNLDALDRHAATQGRHVELWRTAGRDWTLVSLSDRRGLPVVLILERDFTPCAATLQALAHSLAEGDREVVASLDEITRRLTRALADTTGVAAVGEVVLHHVVEAVPSRVASLAVATPEGELSIVATCGYPRALVEHLRITSGTGVIGGVHRSQEPLLVQSLEGVGLDRRRSRYQTESFVAVPIVAGPDALGVISLTDKIPVGPYTRDDIAAAAVLMAPTALALGRERVWHDAQAYAQAAVIDPVSGLFNRRYFQARLEEELQRAIRQHTSIALLMVDLDGFKGINDRFGHVAGDTVIRDISEILRRSVRIFDVCTRFGGEEFAVMMPGGSLESASAMAERIRQRVEAHQRTEADLSGLRVTASIGVAVAPPAAVARDLIERSDRALYHAKNTGKNRVSLATADGSIVAA